MSTILTRRDARTVAVENASYRWAYLFVSFGLLLIVAYRSFVQQEAPWDLIGLVVLAGMAATVYQGFRNALTRQWVGVTLVTIVIGCVMAAAIVFLR